MKSLGKFRKLIKKNEVLKRSAIRLRRSLFTSNLRFRAVYKSCGPSRKKIQNIFYATVQKTGSQWIKAVFSDQRIVEYTGLLTYPQHRYEWDEFHKAFPKFVFVPGLYISYDQYEEIQKPRLYKTFYVIRDPRNIVISWYYSMLKTHTLMGKVPKYRQDLQALSFEDGITYCIKALQLRFAFMRSWIYNANDPNVLIVKFEDVTQHPTLGFKEIFDHCGIAIPSPMLEEILKDYSKDRMRGRDLARRKDYSMSHYRTSRTDWKDVFTEEHRRLFYSITGDLVDLLGYSK